MLAPFTPSEVSLLERTDFQYHASISPQLTATLQAGSATDEEQPARNDLGQQNEELLEALDRFLAGNPSDADRRTAQQLSTKISAALAAAERP